jgi:hypothetical protein
MSGYVSSWSDLSRGLQHVSGSAASVILAFDYSLFSLNVVVSENDNSLGNNCKFLSE